MIAHRTSPVIAMLKRCLLLASCLMVLVAMPWLSARAGAAAPALAVEPARGPCDGRFVARGRGFVPGEEVMVYVRPEYVPRTAPPAGAPARADARGSFAVPIPGEFVSCLPSKAPDGAQPHEVTAVALSGRAAASFVAIPAPRRCFPATGHCVAGRFLTYWEANGGLARNGYPLSDVFVQRLEDGQEYAVQYFERVRLEAHEEVFDVLLGQFGRRILATVPGAPTGPVPPVADGPGRRYFPETGHRVSGRFLAYWEQHGGLPQFGYPLSEEFTQVLEDGRAYTVQYFERARFEDHPENPEPHRVLLGQFGRRILAETTGR